MPHPHPHRLPLSFLALLTGCSNAYLGGMDVGVTAGGMQDIGLAREIIAAGGIPRHDHFTAEGLLSEHDLPLSGETCTEVLCPRAAATVVSPLDGSADRALVQLGFGTAFTTETFSRQPLNLSVAVDVSGSMSGEKLEAVQVALHKLIDQLDAEDQLGLIAFSSRAHEKSPVRIADARGREALHDAVDRLRASGGTDIEAGLELSYGQVAPDAGRSDMGHRVMLLTDAQPNIGATGISSFLGMTRYYAEAGIGLTVFGVGMDLGSELMTAISETRGGNAFTLLDRDAIRTVFDEDFDYLVSPVAYDLSVEVRTAADDIHFLEAYGAPLDREREATTCGFGVTTLFLSSRSGGIGVALDLPAEQLLPGVALADFALRYETPKGDIREADLSIDWQGGTEIQGQDTLADDLGVYKMAPLIDAFHALQAGADFCDGALPGGETHDRVVQAARRLREVAEHLEDAGLAEEVQLMERLARNIEDSGQSACWSADTYIY